MDMNFSALMGKAENQIITDELVSTMAASYPFPRLFFSSDFIDAWAAVLGGERRAKQVADRFIKLHLDLHISQKKVKYSEPEVILSLAYSLPNLKEQILKNGGQRQYDELNICAQTEHLLGTLLPSELTWRMDESSYWSLTQAVEEIRTAFPLALSLVAMGLSSKYYRYLLAMPYLVAMLTQVKGAQRARLIMVLHVTLVERPIYGLASTALIQWPELREEFSYTLRAARNIAIGAESSDLPTSSVFANALRDNLLKLATTLVSGASTLDSPFKALGIISSIASNAAINHYSLACEYLSGIYISRILDMYECIQEKAELAECNAPEVRQDLAGLEPGSITLPESFSDELNVLCRTFFTEAAFNEQLLSWESKKSKFDALAAEVESQRTLLHRLTAAGTTGNIGKLTAAATRMAEQAGDLKVVWEEMLEITLGMHEEYHDFVMRWNSLCEDRKPDIMAVGEGQDELDDLEQINTLLTVERDAARQEAYRLLSKIDVLTHARQNLVAVTPEFPVNLARKIVRDPGRCTPRDALEYTQALAGSKIVVLPSAWQSADESERFEFTPRLLQLLDTLVFDYAPALDAGTPDAQARDLFGGAYAAKESDSTRSDTEMARERTFDYAGQPHLFERHLKIGNSPGANRAMRIYFDIIDGKVVIAYCGQHLTMASSN